MFLDKKLKIKKEEFSQSDGETDNRRERISSSGRQAREIKQEVSEMAVRSSSDTDSETHRVPVKVKTEPLDRGYERNEGREQSPENDRNRKDDYHSRLNSKSSERSAADSGHDEHLKSKESGSRGVYRNLEGYERQRNSDHRERQRRHGDGRERAAYDQRLDEGDRGRRDSVAKDRRRERLSGDESASSRRRETEGDRRNKSWKTRDSDCRNIGHRDDHSEKKRDDRDFTSAKECRKRSYQDRSSDDGSTSPRTEDKRSRKRR